MRSFLLWLRALLDPGAVEREIEDEIRFHIDSRSREYRLRGHGESEARELARLRFGDVSAVEDECRRLRMVERTKGGISDMSAFVRDARHAIRLFAKTPGPTAVILATLALGIGANTAIFSLVEAVVLRPLPYPDPDRLVSLWENDRLRGTRQEGFSLPDYVDLDRANDVFDGVAAYFLTTTTWTSRQAEPRRLTAFRVSASIFHVLGVSPAFGRGFREEEDRAGSPPVAIVSDGAFRSWFGGRREILGTRVVLDGVAREIVGVMPEGFDFPPSRGAAAALYLPLEARPDTPRGNHGFEVVARLKEGVGLDEANAQIEAIAASLEAAYPDDNLGRGMWCESLHEGGVGRVRSGLFLLWAAVGLVLLVACVNVGSVLSSRGLSRRREMAIRSALGAERTTLVRQQLAESLLLSAGGAALGLVASVAARRAFLAMAPSDLPRASDVGINAAVLGFTLAVSVLAAVAFGVIPAFSSSRADLRGAMTESTHRVRRLLLVGEIALAVALAFAAGLLVRSFLRLVRVDPGFGSTNVVAIGLDLPASRYPQEFSDWPRWSRVRAFQSDLVAGISERSGIESAAIALNTPLDPGWTSRFAIEGRPEVAPGQQDEARVRAVSSGYFRTVGLGVTRGRALSPEDERPGAPPTVVVNEAFAERYFANDEVIGARLTQWGITREIVGVVKNERFRGLGEEVPPALYPPFAQAPFTEFFLLVRSRERPDWVVGVVRETIRDLDRELAFGDVATLAERLSRSVAAPRFTTSLLSVFASLALGLAFVGTYGVMSQTVGERTRELGVRLSLGARPRDVVVLVLGQGLRWSALGVALGLALALAAGKAVEGHLFGVRWLDPLVLASVISVVFAASLLASYLPARRASRIDPLPILKAD